MQWHSSAKIRKQKPLRVLSMSDLSQCLVHQLNCSGTKVRTSRLHFWRALLSIWHSKMQDDCIPHTMQWTGGKIPPDYSKWSESWLQTRRLNGNNISLNFCRPTTVPDLLSWGTYPTIWCLGATSPPCRLFLPCDWCKYKSPSCPTYVEEVQKHFKEAYAEAQHQSNSEADRQKRNYDKYMSTVQMMLGDIVLKKVYTFQGKRKVKDHWSKVEYEVICQVTNGVPSYEMKDSSGNVKVTHCNWLFLLATPKVKSHPCLKVRTLKPVCQPSLH